VTYRLSASKLYVEHGHPYEVPLNMGDLLALREGYSDETIPQMALTSPMQALLLWMYERCSHTIHWPERMPSYGFGHSSQGVFTGFEFNTMYTNVRVNFMKRRYLHYTHVNDLSTLLELYPRAIPNSLQTGNGEVIDRKAHILPLLEQGKEGVKHVKLFLEQLVRKSNAGESTYNIINEGLPAVT